MKCYIIFPFLELDFKENRFISVIICFIPAEDREHESYILRNYVNNRE